jgi:hypothetical protein
VARVLCVHGIGQQHKGEASLASEWGPALRDGIRRSGGGSADALGDHDVRCAFYGDIFRPAGRRLDANDPWLTAADATDFEADLLMNWWQGAAEVDPHVIDPYARTLARTPNRVQAALRALSGSTFFAGLAARALLFDLRQVRCYFMEPETRQMVQDRVAEAVDDDTRVLVGHSLGSIVAYEVLCAHPEWPIRALVTLGAPLGVRNLIFDRLVPAPIATNAGIPAGAWPGVVGTWTNVADMGDIVALVKDLRPLFSQKVTCVIVNNGSHAHAVAPYLTAPETGAAIAAGLDQTGHSS